MRCSKMLSWWRCCIAAPEQPATYRGCHNTVNAATCILLIRAVNLATFVLPRPVRGV